MRSNQNCIITVNRVINFNKLLRPSNSKLSLIHPLYDARTCIGATASLQRVDNSLKIIPATRTCSKNLKYHSAIFGNIRERFHSEQLVQPGSQGDSYTGWLGSRFDIQRAIPAKVFAIGAFDAEGKERVCLRWRKAPGACFSRSLFQKEARRAFALSHSGPSTNGRSARLKASSLSFPSPGSIARVCTAVVSISARVASTAATRCTRTCTYIHGPSGDVGLSNNNRDCLLACFVRGYGEEIGQSQEDWPALIPKVGVPIFTNSTWKIREFRAAARTCSPGQTFPGLLVKLKRSISYRGGILPSIRTALMQLLILDSNSAFRIQPRTQSVSKIRKLQINFFLTRLFV